MRSTLKLIPCTYSTIAEKRLLIGFFAERRGHNKFLMLDDDINFLRRISPGTASQMTITDLQDTNEMLTWIENSLDTYPQVGIGFREVNKTAVLGEPPLLEECGKCMRAVAYQTSVFRSLDTARVPVMEDYDTTLQILESGRKNAILWYWMSGQRSTNQPGGCSSWRTLEVHNQAVYRMHELHPHVTRIREKRTFSGGALANRLELTIQWKKAYRCGTSRPPGPSGARTARNLG